MKKAPSIPSADDIGNAEMPAGKADEIADNKKVNADADASDKFDAARYNVLGKKALKFGLNKK